MQPAGRTYAHSLKLPASQRNGLRSRSRSTRQRRTAPLGVEALEQRCAPVVGATAIAPVVDAGTGFDGVTLLSLPGGVCTGSLLSTGRHILTAAHCVDANTNG